MSHDDLAYGPYIRWGVVKQGIKTMIRDIKALLTRTNALAEHVGKLHGVVSALRLEHSAHSRRQEQRIAALEAQLKDIKVLRKRTRRIADLDNDITDVRDWCDGLARGHFTLQQAREAAEEADELNNENVPIASEIG